ncbi:MAG TPA: GNAT family N-acetyltransferase [Gaiellaceae bacterium]|nr:GNAT family N-acetyltransferase [Gaiellaceae bacterium]
MPVEVKRLTAAEARQALDALADVLCDAVDGGDSVSFMDGFGTDDARAFYESLLPELEGGTRVLLAAYVDGDLVGTVQLVHAWPPNSQHRADVAKLLVHRRVRGRGVGRALMEQLEQEARADGKSLLILDTVAGRAADRLYDRLGWTRLGTVPGYARDPDGSFCDATFFYKHL